MISIQEARTICAKQNLPLTQENISKIIEEDIEDRAAMTGHRDLTKDEIDQWISKQYNY